MSKTAFLFPGQGSQFAGMGKALHDEYPVAQRAFQEADDVLGFKLSTLCFEGPDEELKRTENTQPALLAVSIAAYRVLQEKGLAADLVAGHSLGEYSALVAAQALSFADALQLVRKRGQFMQQAVPDGVGAMAAILNLSSDKLDGILAAAAQGETVSAANFNSPTQVVIAGHAGAVARAMELAKQAGAKRAIALPVSAPFHCSLMLPAQQELSPHLNQTVFSNLTIPLINNWQARVVTTGDDARQGLIQQIPNAVQWVEAVRQLKRSGVERFVEVGPGTVLIGLCRGIEPEMKGVKFGTPTDMDAVFGLLS